MIKLDCNSRFLCILKCLHSDSVSSSCNAMQNKGQILAESQQNYARPWRAFVRDSAKKRGLNENAIKSGAQKREKKNTKNGKGKTHAHTQRELSCGKACVWGEKLLLLPFDVTAKETPANCFQSVCQRLSAQFGLAIDFCWPITAVYLNLF